MTLLPIFLKLAGRPALVVGGGTMAAPRIEALLAAEETVTVIAPKLTAKVTEWSAQGKFEWVQRAFMASDVAGMALVFAATGIREIDRAVFDASAEERVLCNAVDDPEYCDFYAPAIVRRGDLQIAISTNGQSPALAQQIRQELEAQFDPAWAATVADLGRRRQELLTAVPERAERIAMLHAQAAAALRAARPGRVRRAAVAVQKWLNRDDDKVPLI